MGNVIESLERQAQDLSLRSQGRIGTKGIQGKDQGDEEKE